MHGHTHAHTYAHTPSLVHRSVSPGVSIPEAVVVGVYREHLSLSPWWWVCLAVSIPEPVCLAVSIPEPVEGVYRSVSPGAAITKHISAVSVAGGQWRWRLARWLAAPRSHYL